MRPQKYNSQQNEALAAEVGLTGQQQRSPGGGAACTASGDSSVQTGQHQMSPPRDEWKQVSTSQK